MPRLFLRVLSEATQLADGEGYDIGIEWLIKENDGEVRSYGLTDYRGLADIADPNVDWLADSENTVVFIPSQFVLMVNCEVPGRNIAQIKRALPFAAEEYVASDIESMHIAHASIKPGQPIACNILANQQIESWLACFESLGVRPGYFICDAQSLPKENDVATVLFDGEVVLLTSADEAALIDRGNLAFTLNTLNVSKVICINGDLTDLELAQLEQAPEIEFFPVSEAGVLDYFASRFPGTDTINLLQGKYQARRSSSPHMLRLRGIGALAALWLVVAFLGMLGQAWWAGNQAQQLEADSFALYKTIFPNESQPVSPEQLRRRMAAKVGEKISGEAGSAFVDLVANFANVLDNSGKVMSISYTEHRRELSVEVKLANYDQLDVIKSKLAGVGIAIDVTSAEEEGTQIRSRLRVRYAS